MARWFAILLVLVASAAFGGNHVTGCGVYGPNAATTCATGGSGGGGGGGGGVGPTTCVADACISDTDIAG